MSFMDIRVKSMLAMALLLWPVAGRAQTLGDLKGCWILNSVVIEKPGERLEPFGPKPVGQLIYTSDNHMSVFQSPPDLALGATGDPTTPGDRVVQTYVAYIGTYTLDGRRLSMNITGATRADWRNTTR